MGDYSLYKVLDMVDKSSSTFKFKLFKKNLTVTRHVGILVYLDGERMFSVDVGVACKGVACLVSQPRITVEFNDRPPAFNIQLSGDYIQQLFYSAGYHTGKEKTKRIIRGWYGADHGDYDLLTNNCRHFCDRCIDIARNIDENACIEDGLQSAYVMLGMTYVADHVYNLPLLPLNLARNAFGTLGTWIRK